MKCEYQREWTVFSGHKHTSAYCQNLGLDPATNPKLERGWVTFANLHGAVWMDWSALLSGGGKQMILSYLS